MALMTNPDFTVLVLGCMKELSLSLFSWLLMLISLPMVVRTLVQHCQVMNHQQKEDCTFLFKLINRSGLNPAPKFPEVFCAWLCKAAVFGDEPPTRLQRIYR